MTKTALILGATGGFGGAAAAALAARGWRLLALHRNPTEAAKMREDSVLGSSAVQWIAGDAMSCTDVVAAARSVSGGVDVIIHGVNPPGYKNWRGLALPMLENAIAAAEVTAARLVFPGNVYNFGTDAFPTVAETASQKPNTRKGAVRVEMEALLQQASTDQGLRVLIVRAGDYFGADAAGSWLSTVMVKPGRKLKSVIYPGDLEIGHSWTYLPDLGETVARLLDRENALGRFESFHFAGHDLGRGGEMIDAFRQAVGREELAVRALPWSLVALASPFVETLREVREMRYLWQMPVRLNNHKLRAFLGEEPHTPLDEAVAATLAGMGCLP
jgi:nucleoside-diphosphate-sugar epimerase